MLFLYKKKRQPATFSFMGDISVAYLTSLETLEAFIVKKIMGLRHETTWA